MPFGLPTAEQRQTAAEALQILATLQTTLDVERLLELFVSAMKAKCEFGHVRYRHDDAGIGLDFGQPAIHSCVYRLCVDHQELGELTISRGHRFSEGELARLEFYLAILIYPLRNALLFHAAQAASRTDPLTGVNNRSAMEAALRHEVALAKRNNMPLAMIMIDVDRFKRVNDSYGHQTGDAVLRQVARCVAGSIRDTDVLSRYGGEEFAVLLNNTNASGALKLAERIRRNMESTSFSADEGQAIPVTISLGVASLAAGDDSVQLIKKADQALYAAKEAGRNCIRCHENVRQAVTE